MKQISQLFVIIVFIICIGNKTNAQNIYTFAGISGTAGYGGDGGLATLSNINGPAGITTDTATGNIYFCDSRNNVVRKITSAGVITTFAGIGAAGYAGDGGPATLANLSHPVGITLDRYHNVYITDVANNVIRKVDTAGIITTIAGNHTAGYSGNGGPAIAAQLREPMGIVVDSFGIIYFADSRNNVVRMIDGLGNINNFVGTSVAGFSGDGGSAISAQLSRPLGITLKANGSLYIADSRNNVIRVVNSIGIISTFAGTAGSFGYSGDGGPATNALLYKPSEVKIDQSGNLFIADSSNTVRIVGINDTISTFAGTGTIGYYGDGGPATNARMTTPDGITFDNAHNVYIATLGNNVIRRVGLPITGISITSNVGDTICFGNLIHFTASVFADTAPHYQWHINGTIVGSDSIVFTPTGLVTGDTVSCYLLDSAGGTPVAISNKLILDSLPRTGVIVGPTTFCVGNFANVTHVGVPGGGIWAISNPVLASLTPPSRITGLATGIDTVYYILSNMCGVDSARFSFSIGINNIGKISGPNKICAGSTVLFSDTTFGGRWKSRPPTRGTIDSMTGSFTANFIQGPDYITYGTSPGCYVIDTINIYNLGLISGSSSLCLGNTASYTDTSIGGRWSIYPTTAGSIDSLLGTLSVNTTTPGIAVISYAISSVCNITASVIINQPGDISSLSNNVCVGNSIVFSDTSLGGVWGSTPLSMGTIDAAGNFIAGTTAGQAIISYTTLAGCFATDTVTINALPNIAPITGPSRVDSIWSITLADSIAGGKWSCSDTLIAKVDSTTGVVTGVSAGVVTITYTITNIMGCTSYVTYSDTVINAAGVATLVNNQSVQIYPNPANGKLNIYWSNQCLGKGEIKIADVTGKTVYVASIQMDNVSGKTQLDVSGLRQGIYILTIKTTNGYFYGKLEISN